MAPRDCVKGTMVDPRPIRTANLANPLIVALYGGPGTGKSTTASLVFGALKQQSYSVELVHEVAKDFTWERRWDTLKHQPYVVAKQLRNYDRCYGQVEAIITDTSSLLGLIYGDPDTYPSPEAFHHFANWLKADWAGRRTLNVFLERDPSRGYDPAGRSQTAEEAQGIDQRVLALLDALSVPTMTVRMDKNNNSHVTEIVEEVKLCLA